MIINYTLSNLALAMILCCGWFDFSYAYNSEKEGISLLEAIEIISKEYEVYFTFDMTLVANVKVEYERARYGSAEEAIASILQGTGLKYKFYDHRFVILYKEDAEGLESLRKMSHHLDGLISEGEKKIDESARPKVSTVPLLTNHLLPRMVKKISFSVEGTVVDQGGEHLIGVNIQVKGTNRGTATDVEGYFTLDDIDENAVLVVSYIGYQTQEIPVSGKSVLAITLISDSELLDEVVVVGYGTQTKESLVGSVTTVTPKDLKVPSSNLTTAFAGRVAGIISYQNSGEPGQDNAQFFIRGSTSFGFRQNPLILVDGVELTLDDLARLQTDDIESFSIFKDATATAIYGARGANGIISVNTKSGELGKPRVNIRFESTFSQPTQNVEFADPLTYLKLHNEAVRTRDGLGILPYSQNKIDNTLKGGNSNVYPTMDWQNQLLKEFTFNQRFNFSVSGGGKVAQYYVSGSLNQDNGILKVDERNNFNSNINLKKFLLRSNVNINLTKTTEAVVRLHATMDDYTGPIPSGSDIYNMITRTNPVRFPAFYEPDEANLHTSHILFGNDDDGNYINPYAELVRGYRDYSRSLNLVQIEVKQDLDFIVPGLRWRILGNNNRTSSFGLNRSFNPFYYSIGSYNQRSDIYVLKPLNESEGTEFLTFNPSQSDREINTVFYLETALNYDRTYGEGHAISGLVVGIARQFLDGNAEELQLSLPSRNLGISGRFTYNYQSRYFSEINFGYNGSERFSKKFRYGFFPSIGLGWVISNEKFWPFENMNKLKLRGSYGIVGNDAIGMREDRFFYLSNVNLIDINRGAAFGTNFDYAKPGVSISRYENKNVTWETAFKTNLGLELGFFQDGIQIQGEVFHEKRTNILQTRVDIPSLVGLQAPIRANIGEALSGGFEVSMNVNHYFSPQFWISMQGNYIFTTSQFSIFEEPDYNSVGAPWLTRIGRPLNQAYGLIAERLFIDEEDVSSSPPQNFGPVMGGDIKYLDINGDGIISSLDRVPIGESTEPEVSYGIGFSLGYKSFDLSAFIQGLDRISFFIDSYGLSPFSDVGGNGKIAETQLLKNFAESHWSEDNRDLFAVWPRLSTEPSENNFQTNTWFLRNGAFLRLKQVELGYNISNKTREKSIFDNIRIYLSGTNILHFSHFKLWDPELRGNGLNYPLQRTINGGIQINF